MSEDMKKQIYDRLSGIVSEMNAIVEMIERSGTGKNVLSIDKKTAKIGKIIFDEEVIE